MANTRIWFILAPEMIYISSFYRFIQFSPESILALESDLTQSAKSTGLLGLILLGSEGINGTVAGSAEAIRELKALLADFAGLADLAFKDSVGPKQPFQVFKIKVKDEIVTLNRTDLVPRSPSYRHLSPAEWDKALKDPDVLVLDTRNDYEVDIGKFKGAQDFRTAEFHEFPEKLKEAGIPQTQKVLIYCTGGIRCEKAILAMEEQGFDNVYQLEGGILNYLQDYPNGDFEGECFVFDYRVAVDANLQPTRKYTLCPHCGQPANFKINCAQCQGQETICHNCSTVGQVTCSKNCAHHHAIGSNSRKSHVQELSKRHRLPET